MPTLSADGDTVESVVSGLVHVHGSGSFGGGTMTWKYLGKDGSYHDIAEAAYTQAFDKLLEFPDPVSLKGTLSGSTGPSLYYEINS